MKVSEVGGGSVQRNTGEGRNGECSQKYKLRGRSRKMTRKKRVAPGQRPREAGTVSSRIKRPPLKRVYILSGEGKGNIKRTDSQAEKRRELDYHRGTVERELHSPKTKKKNKRSVGGCVFGAVETNQTPE